MKIYTLVLTILLTGFFLFSAPKPASAAPPGPFDFVADNTYTCGTFTNLHWSESSGANRYLIFFNGAYFDGLDEINTGNGDWTYYTTGYANFSQFPLTQSNESVQIFAENADGLTGSSILTGNNISQGCATPFDFSLTLRNPQIPSSTSPNTLNCCSPLLRETAPYSIEITTVSGTPGPVTVELLANHIPGYPTWSSYYWSSLWPVNGQSGEPTSGDPPSSSNNPGTPFIYTIPVIRYDPNQMAIAYGFTSVNDRLGYSIPVKITNANGVVHTTALRAYNTFNNPGPVLTCSPAFNDCPQPPYSTPPEPPTPTPTPTPIPPTPTPTPIPTATPGPTSTPTPTPPPSISCGIDGPTTLLTGQGATYVSTSTASGTSITSYIWQGTGFPTGFASTYPWTPTSPGVYTLSLTVDDGAGGASPKQCSVEITVTSPTPTPVPPTPTPVPSIFCGINPGPTSLPTGQVGNYVSNSNANNTTITEYTWSANGGSPTSGFLSSFNWSSSVPGFYNITLTVDDGPGGAPPDSCDVVVTVSNATPTPTGGPPTPTTTPLSITGCSVSPNPAQIGQQVLWTAFVSGGTGSYTYSWDDNGTPDATRNFGPTSATSDTWPRTYSAPGAITATVTVTSGTVQSRTCPVLGVDTSLPWIQTTGGDVHTNESIYTPGGPTPP